MKELIILLSLFRHEAYEAGINLSDSMVIQYSNLGIDTLGRTTHKEEYWLIEISNEVEPEILSTIVYHELGHVLGLKDSKGISIMNYNYLIPLTDKLKKKLFNQIKSI